MATEQRWWCDECGTSGTVPVEDREGMWSVVTKIREDHLAKMKAGCTGNLNRIRIQNADDS